MQDETAHAPEFAATDVGESRPREKLVTGALLGGAGAVTLGWVSLLGWGAVRLVGYFVG